VRQWGGKKGRDGEGEIGGEGTEANQGCTAWWNDRGGEYGDVEHEAKKAKVDGMHLVIDKNRVDVIMSQISVMHGLEDIYVSRMGREEYERRLVNLVNQMPGMIENTLEGDDLFTPWFNVIIYCELYGLNYITTLT
jgi:hypothetical protein